MLKAFALLGFGIIAAAIGVLFLVLLNIGLSPLLNLFLKGDTSFNLLVALPQTFPAGLLNFSFT